MKIAILDSGLGQSYLEQEDLLENMNIVKMVDFTG